MSTDETRLRILSAAGQMFADQGFEATTVRGISKAAQVNLASVNYHFGDKKRLYIETVRQAHQRRAGQVPLPGWSEGVTAATKLTDLVRTLLTRMIGVQGAPWETRLMMREVLRPTEACEEMVEEYFRPLFDAMLGVLDEILPHETPRPRCHQIALSIVGQCLLYRVSGEVVTMLVGKKERSSHYSVDALADHIAHFTLAALGQVPPLSNPTSPKQTPTASVRG